MNKDTIEREDRTDWFELYDIVDIWYHEHTRHHLVDVDENAGQMIAKLEAWHNKKIQELKDKGEL